MIAFADGNCAVCRRARLGIGLAAAGGENAGTRSLVEVLHAVLRQSLRISALTIHDSFIVAMACAPLAERIIAEELAT